MCSKTTFLTGLGMGMVAGSAVGMMIASDSGKKNNGKNMVARCLRNMGDVIDDVSSAMSK